MPYAFQVHERARMEEGKTREYDPDDVDAVVSSLGAVNKALAPTSTSVGSSTVTTVSASKRGSYDEEDAEDDPYEDDDYDKDEELDDEEEEDEEDIEDEEDSDEEEEPTLLHDTGGGRYYDRSPGDVYTIPEEEEEGPGYHGPESQLKMAESNSDTPSSLLRWRGNRRRPTHLTDTLTPLAWPLVLRAIWNTGIALEISQIISEPYQKNKEGNYL